MQTICVVAYQASGMNPQPQDLRRDTFFFCRLVQGTSCRSKRKHEPATKQHLLVHGICWTVGSLVFNVASQPKRHLWSMLIESLVFGSKTRLQYSVTTLPTSQDGREDVGAYPYSCSPGWTIAKKKGLSSAIGTPPMTPYHDHACAERVCVWGLVNTLKQHLNFWERAAALREL
ncbi:hypothetical protein VFPPC_01835 [Pochonia chlamydosporia 170]|uniref:Uncharacterized protein n=1 Tax=Pochonia chlamydosporia 170 TaxID=1380566 RepID=A0A179GA61_METCM|nr:hypothetical protein VFPPC_01835 [Pochonia chlamydosporia 170]OAQ74301.1 hypothetical protein VFPPC_01835 [Pochonia chlamydosporia 170]